MTRRLPRRARLRRLTRQSRTLSTCQQPTPVHSSSRTRSKKIVVKVYRAETEEPDVEKQNEGRAALAAHKDI